MSIFKGGAHLKKFLRYAALLQIAAMILSLFAFLPYAYAGDEEGSDIKEIVNITLGQNVKAVGSSTVEMGTNKMSYPQEKGGRYGWMLISANALRSSYIGVDIDNSITSGNKDGDYYEVEIDYYDDGISSVFTLVYDSVSDSEREAECFSLEGTSKWRTHTYYLDDANFANGVDGKYDFKVAIRTKHKITSAVGNVLIGAIRVKKAQKKYPVRATSALTDVTGNNFSLSEDKIFHVNLHNNLKEDKDVLVTYKAVDNEKNVQWQKTENITVSAKKDYKTDVLCEAQRNCLYEFVIEVTDSENSFLNVYKVPFAVFYTREDGEVNHKFGYTLHYAWNYRRYPEEEIPLLAKINAGAVRGGLPWRSGELAKGSYAIPDEFQKFLDVMLRYPQLEYLGSITYSNLLYDNNRQQMPSNPEAVEASSKYQKWFFNKLLKSGIDLVGIEFWNEPNLEKYGGVGINNYEYYKKSVVKIAEDLKPVVPKDIEFGALGVTHIFSETVKDEWILPLINEGQLGTTFEVLSVHPYNYAGIPEKDIRERLELYKEAYEKKNPGKKFKMWHTEHNFVPEKGPVEDEEDRARFNVRMYVMLNAIGACEKYYSYGFTDGGASGSAAYILHKSTTNNLGSFMTGYNNERDVLYQAKDTVVAFAAMNALLADAPDAPYVIKDDRENHKYAFMFERPADRKKVITAWSLGEAEQMTLDLGVNDVVLYDIYANPTKLHSDDGIFTFTSSESMSYIEGDFVNPKFVETSKLDTEKNVYNVAVGDNITLRFSNNSDTDYDIKADTGDNYTLVSADSSVKAKSEGEIVVKVPPEEGIKSKIRIYFEKDGKVENVLIYELKSKAISDFTIESSLVGKNDLSKWDAVVKITNNSAVKPLKGTIKITSPSHLATKIPAQVKIIPCQTTGIVSFELPKITELKETTVGGVFETEDGITKTFEASVDFGVILYTDRKPTIDGYGNEWNEKSGVVLDTIDSVYRTAGKGWVWEGVDDQSALLCTMLDEDYFYLYVKVKDDIDWFEKNGDAGWADDSVQFGIVTEQRTSSDDIGGTYTKILLSRNADDKSMVKYRSASEGNEIPIGNLSDKSELVIRRDGDYTYYEAAIAWEDIRLNKPDIKNLESVFFSMIINENDGLGREGWLRYGDGIGSTQDTSLFKRMKIVK